MRWLGRLMEWLSRWIDRWIAVGWIDEVVMGVKSDWGWVNSS